MSGPVLGGLVGSPHELFTLNSTKAVGAVAELDGMDDHCDLLTAPWTLDPQLSCFGEKCMIPTDTGGGELENFILQGL